MGDRLDAACVEEGAVDVVGHAVDSEGHTVADDERPLAARCAEAGKECAAHGVDSLWRVVIRCHRFLFCGDHVRERPNMWHTGRVLTALIIT